MNETKRSSQPIEPVSLAYEEDRVLRQNAREAATKEHGFAFLSSWMPSRDPAVVNGNPSTRSANYTPVLLKERLVLKGPKALVAERDGKEFIGDPRDAQSLLTPLVQNCGSDPLELDCSRILRQGNPEHRAIIRSRLVSNLGSHLSVTGKILPMTSDLADAPILVRATQWFRNDQRFLAVINSGALFRVGDILDDEGLRLLDVHSFGGEYANVASSAKAWMATLESAAYDAVVRMNIVKTPLGTVYSGARVGALREGVGYFGTDLELYANEINRMASLPASVRFLATEPGLRSSGVKAYRSGRVVLEPGMRIAQKSNIVPWSHAREMAKPNRVSNLRNAAETALMFQCALEQRYCHPSNPDPQPRGKARQGETDAGNP